MLFRLWGSYHIFFGGEVALPSPWDTSAFIAVAGSGCQFVSGLLMVSVASIRPHLDASRNFTDCQRGAMFQTLRAWSPLTLAAAGNSYHAARFLASVRPQTYMALGRKKLFAIRQKKVDGWMMAF